MTVQFLLPVLQTNRQIRGSARAPEKIEVIPHSLALVQLRHRAKEPVLSLETDRCILHGRRFARRRRTRKLSAFPAGLHVLILVRVVLLPGYRFGQKVKFRFPKLKGAVQRRRQGNNPLQYLRPRLVVTEDVRERNEKEENE